ncbi:MAG: hypothetical protein K8R86_08045 [Bacteroidales bacterium]|nr:hypothetical protein [Bacteroidales bacterium]
MKPILLSFIIFMFLLEAAFADPVVSSLSDNLTHNSLITITGSDFGEKTTAAPLHFDNFENCTAGQTLGDSLAHWTERDGPTYDQELDITDNSIQRHNLSVKCITTGSLDIASKEAWINNVGFASTGKCYLNYWIRIKWGEKGMNPYWQIKGVEMAVSTNPNASDVFPMIGLLHWTYPNSSNQAFPAIGTKTYSYYQTYRNPSGGDILAHSNYCDVSQIPGDFIGPIWVNVSIAVDQGSIGATDAKAYYWLQKPSEGGIIKNFSKTGINLRDDADYIHNVHIHDYVGTGATGQQLWYDDFYIDNSWARVEIGDNASYDSCSLREIQIPTAWSSGGTSITATVNQGSFPTGEAYYLFVVDAKGVASAGYPVSFAAGGVEKPSTVLDFRQ